MIERQFGEVDLMLKAPDEDAGSGATAPPVQEERRNKRQQSLILVVDDEPRMRESVKELLAVYGYRCIQAGDASQALYVLSKAPIDLVLLDIHMPGMTGTDLLRRIRDDYKNVSVIMVSGESTFDNATEALRGGAIDFIRKPYKAEHLVRSVQSALHKQRLERAVEQMHQQLGISEKRHRFIVENSPDIIYMLDEDGNFSFVNERVATLLGYAPDEIIGQHFTKFIHPEDVERVKYSFRERRAGKRASRNIEFRFEKKLATSHASEDGEQYLPVELNAMGVYVEPQNGESPDFLGTYGVARDISERKRAEELLNYQLYHDVLTGLPNRALFQDRLEQAVSRAERNKNRFALIFMDMDRFKAINDSYGHIVGDVLLRSVANTMQRYIRKTDTLARIGGDEFNLLLPEVSQLEDAANIAKKIVDHFNNETLLVEGHEVAISFSAGIAVYPDHGTDLTELIHKADTAMYHVKRRGKRGYALYSPAMATATQTAPAMERELRRALIDEQFELVLQPQTDTLSGEVLGAEALIRWNHPERGVVMPASFITYAEETGIIIELGDWVLREACRILRDKLTSRAHEGLVIAVNVSARQLAQTDFASKVLGILQEYGIPGRRIELEITENILMLDVEHAIHQLNQLTSFGVKVAVDDFGVGYSSLSYLHNLPLHTMKIDRSFISEIHSLEEKHSIVTGLIAMAGELGLEVVAEGVETPVQLEFLKRIECPRSQGFLVGRPVPVSQFVSGAYR